MMTPAQLRLWREHHQLSQLQLARRLGVDHMTISRWERGTRQIPSFLLLAIRGLECLNHGQKVGN